MIYKAHKSYLFVTGKININNPVSCCDVSGENVSLEGTSNTADCLLERDLNRQYQSSWRFLHWAAVTCLSVVPVSHTYHGH